MPQEWNKSYISSIYKKGDKKSCSNYRGISVISSMARLFFRVIKGKIEQKHVILREEQSGFRKGRSCLDSIHCVKQLTKKNKHKHIDTHKNNKGSQTGMRSIISIV